MKKLILPLLLTCSLWAHPHVFVDAALEVKTGAGGVEELTVTWIMDEMTSMTFLMDFDANRNGKLEPKEITALETESFAHLHEYRYFLRLAVDGKEIPINVKAQNFAPSIEKNRLVYRFDLPRKIPLKPGQKAEITVADEEGYMAMTLKKEDVRFVGSAPAFVLKQVDKEFFYAWVVGFNHTPAQKLAHK